MANRDKLTILNHYHTVQYDLHQLLFWTIVQTVQPAKLQLNCKKCKCYILVIVTLGFQTSSVRLPDQGFNYMILKLLQPWCGVFILLDFYSADLQKISIDINYNVFIIHIIFIILHLFFQIYNVCIPGSIPQPLSIKQRIKPPRMFGFDT